VRDIFVRRSNKLKDENKMKQQQKRVAGVYLDSTKAVVIRPAPDYEEGDYIVQDKLEAGIHDRGGDKDSKNQAKQMDLLKYYKSVAALLLAYEELYIFGPGNAQEQFQNHLKDDAQFKQKEFSIDSSEQMTEPQMIVKVREHFSERPAAVAPVVTEEL
jgi:stalled ribosome rescue protein Dom34